MQLVKVSKNEQGQQVVNARDLWQFLDVGRHFNSWIKGRIEKYDFIENEDFVITKSLTQNGVKLGRPIEDYVLSLDMAKELSMVENNTSGRLARKYFIQCEKKYKKLIEDKHLKEIKMLQESDNSEIYLKKIEALETNYEEVQKLVKELSEESEILKTTMSKFNLRCVWLSLLAGQGKRLIRESQAEKNRLNYLKILE